MPCFGLTVGDDSEGQAKLKLGSFIQDFTSFSSGFGRLCGLLWSGFHDLGSLLDIRWVELWQ